MTAQAAGVSTAMVSRFVNGSQRLSIEAEATRLIQAPDIQRDANRAERAGLAPLPASRVLAALLFRPYDARWQSRNRESSRWS